MAPGNGQFLHSWGIHSHFAGAGGDRIADPLDPGAQARFVVQFHSIVGSRIVLSVESQERNRGYETNLNGWNFAGGSWCVGAGLSGH
jgi:hypothetical protein